MEKIKLIIKDSFLLILQTIKSPIKQMNFDHNLDWQKLLITYGILFFTSSFLFNVFMGSILLSIPSSIAEVIRSIIIHSLMIGVIFLVLNKINQPVTFIKLAEVWLLAWIPATAASIILTPLTLISSMYSFIIIIQFITIIIFVLLFNLGLIKLQVIKKSRLIICGGILLIFTIMYYQSLKTYTDIDKMNNLIKNAYEFNNKIE